MKALQKLIGCFAVAGLFYIPNSLAASDFYLGNGEVELRIDVVRKPIFPPELLSNGYQAGTVVVAFEVDHTGELRDWIVVQATHPDFADSVARVIESWDFSPPKINGESRSIVSKLEINFRSSGNVVSFDLVTGMATRINEITGFSAESIAIANADDLDKPPTVRTAVNPRIPRDVIERYRGSKAVFTFYVDEQGRVRVPAVNSIDGDVEAGMLLAAQEALSQWRFEPPRRKSAPVNIRLAQAFVFSDRVN